MVAKTAEQFLADIRKGAPANSTAPKPASNPHPVAPIDPKSPISASELDAIYTRGSQVAGTHPHTSGLKAVYEAGAAGKRA